MFKKLLFDYVLKSKFEELLSGTEITQQGLQTFLQDSGINLNQALFSLFNTYFYPVPTHKNAKMAIMLLDLGADPKSIAKSLHEENMSQSDFSPLCKASGIGDLELVKLFILSNADMNRGTEAEAIVEASMWGHLDIVKLLIENKAEINVENEDGFTPLIAACVQGHVDVVKILIRNKADIDKQNRNGRTALLSAIKSKQFDVAKELVSTAKLNPNIQDKEGYTSLMPTGQKKHYDVIKMLLLKYPNANINLVSKCGKNALLLALQSYNCTAGNIRLFLKHNIDVNRRDSMGITPLMMAVSKLREDLVKILLAEGKADPNITDNRSANAIFYASFDKKESIKIIKLLLDYGCNINCTMRYNTTVLSLRLKREISSLDEGSVPLDMMETFLQLGADVNSQDSHGYTLLMLACLLSTGSNEFDSDTEDEESVNILEVLKLLLSFGANVNAVNRKGVDALMLAITREEFPDNLICRFDICDILLENGATVTHHLHAAISRRLTPVVERMIQSGAFPHLITLQKHVIPINYYFPLQAETIFTAEPLSPLFTTFLFGNAVLAQTFICCNFVRTFDLYPPQHLLSALEESIKVLNDQEESQTDSDTSDDYSNYEYDDDFTRSQGRKTWNLFQQIYSQPWPLQTICLVHVSESVGFGPSRYNKISQTGLPKPLQKKLRFDQSIKISSSVSRKVYTETDMETRLQEHFENEFTEINSRHIIVND